MIDWTVSCGLNSLLIYWTVSHGLKSLLIDWTVYFDLLAWWLLLSALVSVGWWLVACGLWLVAVAVAVLPPLHSYFTASLSSLSERRLESRDRLVPGAPWKNSDPWMKISHLGLLDLFGFLENLHKTQNTVVGLFSFVIDCTCFAATKFSNVWIDSDCIDIV